MKVLYSEKNVSTGIAIILGVISLLMAGFFVIQLIVGPLGTRPAPDWLLLVIAVFSIATTINFCWLSVTLTDEGVTVRYGIFRASRVWADVVSCEEDAERRFYGWGIRFGPYKKQWIWIFNVIGGPRVVFLTAGTKPRGLMISVKNPGEVLRVASERIGRS